MTSNPLHSCNLEYGSLDRFVIPIGASRFATHCALKSRAGFSLVRNPYLILIVEKGAKVTGRSELFDLFARALIGITRRGFSGRRWTIAIAGCGKRATIITGHLWLNSNDVLAVLVYLFVEYGLPDFIRSKNSGELTTETVSIGSKDWDENLLH
jgi:hypothetical protein